MTTESIPAGGERLTLDDLRSLVPLGTIHTVMTAIPDMQGRLKGKRMGALPLLERLDAGDGKHVADACSYILATNADMDPLSGFALTDWNDGFHDMQVAADWDTLRALPYMPGVALVHCDALDADGAFIEVAPRQMLRRQVERLAELGVEARIGWESEFVLYNEDGTPVVGHNADYGLDHRPRLADFFGYLEHALHDAGVGPEAVKTESGGGQAEITFPYGDVMKACDDYTVYKHCVKYLAQRHGMRASFMASPVTGVFSGLHLHLHLHLSLWRDGRPLFATGSRLDLPPEVMRQSIAGLIAVMPHLAPLFAQTTNDYKRFVSAHDFAPQYMNWGTGNRGCAVRVTGDGVGTHLENRLAGGSANPYLVAAASLAAIAHGLDEKLTAPSPCLGDAYADKTSRPLPADLSEALDDFRGSQFAHALLSTDVVVHYARAAQAEIDEQHREVTDVERRRFALA
ncbi:glutamine synthetase family protein [Streptomyces sp. NPDC090075]|uniref:glutamine synthetase family protein n=1 Tax=Streptomyces sp. NPDC090075 TaxID=3365937 RepID=UPI0038014384